MKNNHLWLAAQAHETAVAGLKKRIEELEETLNEIYHATSCTTGQMEMIEKVTRPGAGWVRLDAPCPHCKNPWLWRLPEYLTGEERQCPACKAYKGDNSEWITAKREEWPECSGDPACCPENAGYGCCKPNPPECGPKLVALSPEAYEYILGSAEDGIRYAAAAYEKHLEENGYPLESVAVARERMIGYVNEMKEVES